MGIFKIRKVVLMTLMFVTAIFILLYVCPKEAHKDEGAHQNDSVPALHERNNKENTGVLHEDEDKTVRESAGILHKVKKDEDKTPSKERSIKESVNALHDEKHPQKHDISTPEKDYLTGKINYAKDSGFVKLDPGHCNGRNIYVRTEVAEAFEKMRKAALQDDVVLIVLSGARSFEQQKNIWERKWNNLQNQKPKEKALKILKFSSMPMSSRHHWGTDIDLCNLENNYFESGKGLKIYSWLTKNASKYGFCQVYTDKQSTGRTGYEMEKWHWSYMPLSRQLLKRYNKIVKTSDFKGFLGWEMASEVEIIEKYVNGIYECK
jgi:LAS superfamily LD-carboxypeptidase LdcB